MKRSEKLLAFIAENDGQNFNSSNIGKVMQNLEKADADGKLKEFFMNVKPYVSTFPCVVMVNGTPGARKKDQGAIVFALNLYGMSHPGFAERVHKTLMSLAKGSSKQAQAVIVLLATQLDLQEGEISLINFADRELVELVNKRIHQLKGRNIALRIFYLVAGSIGAPGTAMLGLIPLTFVCVFLIIYGFMDMFYWINMMQFREEKINTAARELGEFIEDSETEKEAVDN